MKRAMWLLAVMIIAGCTGRAPQSEEEKVAQAIREYRARQHQVQVDARSILEDYTAWSFADGWCAVGLRVDRAKNKYAVYIVRSENDRWKVAGEMPSGRAPTVDDAMKWGIPRSVADKLDLHVYNPTHIDFNETRRAEGENAGLEVARERGQGNTQSLSRQEAETAINSWFDLCRSGELQEANDRLHRVSRNFYGGFGVDIAQEFQKMLRGQRASLSYTGAEEDRQYGHIESFNLLLDGKHEANMGALRENGRILILVSPK